MVARRVHSPSVFKEGWLRCAINKKIPFLSGADGVVSKRSRSLLINIRVAHLILLEITNHPVCAAAERDLFIEAQPPLLKRRGMSSLQRLSSISNLLDSGNHQKSDVYVHHMHSFRNRSDSSAQDYMMTPRRRLDAAASISPAAVAFQLVSGSAIILVVFPNERC